MLCRGFVLVKRRLFLGRIYALAKRSNSKAASAEFSRRPRKSRRLQLCGRRSRVHRHKRAPNVPNAVQPGILNLEREENTTRPEHPANF
jgi:hypothetical protein